MIEAELADGTILEFPDGTDQGVIDRTVKKHILTGAAQAGLDAGLKGAKVTTREEELKRIGRERVAQSDAKQAFKPGTILGDVVQFGDAARASVANTFGIGPRVMAAFDDTNLPYDDRLAIAREENRVNRDKSLVGDITGLVLGGGGAAGAGKVAIKGIAAVAPKIGNVLQSATALKEGERLKNVAKLTGVGAATGAAQAAGEGTDIGQGATYGGVGGAVVGTAAPVVGNLVESGVRKVATMFKSMKGEPSAKATKIIYDTLQADGLSADDAAKVLDEARSRGVPLALGDIGINLRGQTSSLARKPGESRKIVQDRIMERQIGQGERIEGAIERNLGPVTNVRQASEDLITRARTTAKPLYEEAYSAPVDWTKDEGVLLNRILNTPAGKKALQNAHTIAGNEMRDPGALGFAVKDNGEVVLESVPTFQTLDYVKRGLDDVIDAFPKDPRTGRPALDTNGKAVDQLRRQFVNDLKQRNPAYRRALETYAGDAAMADAVERGKKAVSKSAEDIQFETRRMTPAELDQYKLGIRSGIVDSMESRVDGADKVRALVGSPKKRAALSQVFGGEKGLADFIETLKDEAMGAETYRRAMVGSPTAANVADDDNFDKVLDFVEAGVHAKSGRIRSAINVLLNRRGAADKASEMTRAELSDLLTTSDQQLVNALLKKVGAEELLSSQRLQRGIRYGASGGMGAARDNGGSPPVIDVGTGQVMPPEEPPGPQSMNASPEFDALASRMEQVESGGNQSAVSPKGAVGVMQVMPTTAPEAAALAGLEFDEQRYLSDPEYNRQLGRAYLAEMLNRFGGDVELAVAAYNAGPGAVQEALAAGDNWRNALPAETQDYLIKVLG